MGVESSYSLFLYLRLSCFHLLEMNYNKTRQTAMFLWLCRLDIVSHQLNRGALSSFPWMRRFGVLVIYILAIHRVPQCEERLGRRCGSAHPVKLSLIWASQQHHAGTVLSFCNTPSGVLSPEMDGTKLLHMQNHRDVSSEIKASEMKMTTWPQHQPAGFWHMLLSVDVFFKKKLYS